MEQIINWAQDAFVVPISDGILQLDVFFLPPFSFPPPKTRLVTMVQAESNLTLTLKELGASGSCLSDEQKVSALRKVLKVGPRGGTPRDWDPRRRDIHPPAPRCHSHTSR